MTLYSKFGKFAVIYCYLEISTWLFLKTLKVIKCIVYVYMLFNVIILRGNDAIKKGFFINSM